MTSNVLMPPNLQEHPPSNFNVHNVLAALFKHKKKILLLALIGLAAGAAYYHFTKPVYQSNAALLVRYVIDRSPVDPIEGIPGKSSKTDAGAIIDAEVQILKSWDLAVQVAQALGPKRVLPDSDGEPTVNEAASTIFSGLTVTTAKGSNIMSVAYQNRYPQLTTLVLNELITRYFTKHLEVHRSAGAFDFVSEQTDQVRARLNQTEDALKNLRNKVGMVALPESVAALQLELSHLNEALSTAESELAQQRARVNDLLHTSAASSPGIAPSTLSAQNPGALPVSQASVAGSQTAEVASTESAVASSPNPEASPVKPPASDVERYQGLVARLAELRKNAFELSAKYTAANPLVRANQEQIDSLESERKSLERKYPTLTATVATKTGGVDLATEKVQLAGLEAKTASLRSRLVQLTEVAPQVTELKRNQELEETNYKYFKGALEKARVDEALDPAKMPNISAVQKPSPPAPVTKARDKVALGLAVGGLVLGVALALFKELLLSHTIKRPLELESRLNVSPMVYIPYGGANNSAYSLPHSPNGNGSSGQTKRRKGAKLVPWDSGHFIRPYADAIRDRLGLYFELHDLTRKPKLIGVTGFSDGAGSSTLAAGLAASLSEFGDGKVLLVDVKLGPRDVHPFFRGSPVASLPAALEPKEEQEPAAENLYLATVGTNAGGLAQLGLKRFFDMIPNINGSDYDYIVFDMPPLTQISPTRGLAGFMDKMLLVVEADADNREVVRRGYESLMAERKNVAVILNKVRNYVPKWLDGDRVA